MKIEQFSLQMHAQHQASQRLQIEERLLMAAPAPSSAPASSASPAANGVPTIAAADGVGESGLSLGAMMEDIEQSPRLQLIRAMLAALMGEALPELRLRDAAGGEASTGGGGQSTAALVYERETLFQESEVSTFEAQGTVQTADGRSIAFDLSLVMARHYEVRTQSRVDVGVAVQATDPLVLNFSGTAAELRDQRFEFDLNGDGTLEQMPFVAEGSGFLVFDRNRDGVVNDGLELFGPRSNDGFAELAALDQDGNGWIDENDPDFQDLRVWTRNAAGEDQLQTLIQADVGALAVAHVGTAFSIKDAANVLQGEVRASGVFLRESGQVGLLQQIDLVA